MKKLILLVLFSSLLMSGFFTNERKPSNEEVVESERLCKLFRKKAADYKKKMRDDLLAKVSLASYEERAEMFCTKAKELREAQGGESKEEDVKPTEETNSTENNITELNQSKRS